LEKGGGQEGQYPEWFKGRKDSHTSNTVKTATETPIVWTYGLAKQPDAWIADSAAMVHISSNQNNFSSYHKYDECRDIKAFGKNVVKGIREGDILADVEFKGKVTWICLTKFMHVPDADRKILSLKKLDQKGFEIHIMGGCIRIMKSNEVYAEVLLSSDLYEVKMKIVPSHESVIATVKRDTTMADLSTWHRRLGHLGDTMLKKLVNFNTVKGMEIMNTHLAGICEDCVMGKMDEKPFENQTEHDSLLFGTLSRLGFRLD